jgi:LysR family hydrogen peroxide-inducible transcriptional activator
VRGAPHPVTLRQLQYLVAIAEHKSFRKAAEACRVAQPSLSAQVAQVEEALGVRIFERDRKKVLVTTAGEALIARARRVLLDADDLVDAATRVRDPFASTIRIGVIPTVAPYLLPDVAPALRRAFPKLSVVWVEEKTQVLVEQIHAGNLDAALLAKESELGDLVTAEIGDDPFVLAAPLGHPLARGKRAQLEELSDATVLLLDDGHCLRDQALSLCQRVGAEEASMRATSLSTLAQIVAGGGGVTLLPSLAVPTETRGGGLAIRPFAPRAPSRTLVLAFRPHAALETALQKIAQTMKTAYRESRKSA